MHKKIALFKQPNSDIQMSLLRGWENFQIVHV